MWTQLWPSSFFSGVDMELNFIIIFHLFFPFSTEIYTKIHNSKIEWIFFVPHENKLFWMRNVIAWIIFFFSKNVLSFSKRNEKFVCSFFLHLFYICFEWVKGWYVYYGWDRKKRRKKKTMSAHICENEQMQSHSNILCKLLSHIFLHLWLLSRWMCREQH